MDELFLNRYTPAKKGRNIEVPAFFFINCLIYRD